ncbi:MAG: hypothetical protein HPY50_00325 [Firmicutes bacterium]|nr:hypothetical protein [Bacillota bacterium]
MNKSILVKGLLICLVLLSSLLVPDAAMAARPDAASHLIAVAGDATSIALSWRDNSDDEDGFRILRETEVEGVYVEIAEVAANRTNYGNINLKPGTHYSYRVNAFNDDGDSAPSNTASATTEEAVVRVTSPDGGEEWAWNETHNITWTSNGEGFQAQIRYRYDDSAWIQIATVPNTNSYSWTVPNVNSSHVRVAVRLLLDGDFACVDQSSTDFTIRGVALLIPVVPLESVPAAPSELACSYHVPTVTLTWEDNASNETGFRIERKTGSGAYAELGTVGANVTSYDDSITPTPGTAYTYRVRAYNGAGNSSYSNEREFELAEMLAAPLSPLDLAAESVSDSSIRLTWDNNGSNSGVEVERKTASSPFAKVAETSSGDADYTDAGLFEGTYTYRVRAFNEGLSGDRIYSSYSNEASAAVSAVTVEPPESTETSETSSQTVLRFYIDSTEYYVQGPSDTAGRVQTMDTAPIIEGGRTLLPIRYVSEPLGARVGWEAALDQVTVQLGGQTIVLWINNGTARVNGVETAIDPANPAVTPIIVPPGRTMLPLRFIAENLGCRVEWNAALREVTVTYPVG